MIDTKRPGPRLLVRVGAVVGLAAASVFAIQELRVFNNFHAAKDANPYHGPLPQRVHGPDFPNASDMPNLGELKAHMAEACPTWHLANVDMTPIVALNYWRECDENSILQRGLHGKASAAEIEKARKDAVDALGPSGQEIDRALRHAGISPGAPQNPDPKCPAGEIPVSPLGVKALTHMVCEPLPDGGTPSAGDPPFTSNTPGAQMPIPQPLPDGNPRAKPAAGKPAQQPQF